MEWSPDEYKDIESVNYWKKMQSMYPNDQKHQDYARRVLQRKARDHSRTPIPWTPEPPNAGFCPSGVKPWMRVNDDYPKINVETETKKSGQDLSIFQFWTQEIEIRKKHKETLVYGDFELIGDDSEDSPVFAYVRKSRDENWIVILNFSGKDIQWRLPDDVKVTQWIVNNYSGKPEKVLGGELVLRPWEGLQGML